jgi:hypothetical protein
MLGIGYKPAPVGIANACISTQIQQKTALFIRFGAELLVLEGLLRRLL